MPEAKYRCHIPSPVKGRRFDLHTNIPVVVPYYDEEHRPKVVPSPKKTPAKHHETSSPPPPTKSAEELEAESLALALLLSQEEDSEDEAEWGEPAEDEHDEAARREALLNQVDHRLENGVEERLAEEEEEASMALIRQLMEEDQQASFTAQVRAQDEQRERIEAMRQQMEQRAEAAKEAQVAAATRGYGSLSDEERALLDDLGGSDAEALAELGLSAGEGGNLAETLAAMAGLISQIDLIEDENVEEALVMEEDDMTYENLSNLADVSVGLTPAAVEAIASVVHVEGDELEACCICMCEYDLSEKVKKLGCGHCFHQDCIGEWLHRHTVCPTCKTAVPGETRQVSPERLEQEMP